jgi:hypothetical protein
VIQARTVAPVEPRQREHLQPEHIGEVDHVLGNRGLLRYARCSRVAESRGTVAAKIRHQHPVARFDEGRHHAVPGSNIVRKAVQEDDGEPGAVPGLLISDVEHRSLDRPHVLTGPCLKPGTANGRGATSHRHGSHSTGALQEFSSALGHDRSSDRVG